MERRCKNCEFWDKQKQQNYGSCRRNAPIISKEVYYAYWPVTQSKDWCGEFRPEEKTEQPEQSS